MRDGSPELSMTQASPNRFLEERRRTRRFFNRMSQPYPIVKHLFPEFRRALDRIDLPPALRVLDLATGTACGPAPFRNMAMPCRGSTSPTSS